MYPNKPCQCHQLQWQKYLLHIIWPIIPLFLMGVPLTYPVYFAVIVSTYKESTSISDVIALQCVLWRLQSLNWEAVSMWGGSWQLSLKILIEEHVCSYNTMYKSYITPQKVVTTGSEKSLNIARKSLSWQHCSISVVRPSILAGHLP